VACGQSSSAAEQQSSRAPACDGNQRTRELEAGGMDWRAAHRHGDTTGTTLGHSLASLAHTAGPPGARRLALTGPRLGAFIFDAVPCKKRLVRAKIAARFPTPRRSCDRRRRASCVVVVAIVYLLCTPPPSARQVPTAVERSPALPGPPCQRDRLRQCRVPGPPPLPIAC
jgi:hypothetical protein